MSRDQSQEDLLVRARRGDLDAAGERRLETALQSSRELSLLYEAGVEFDRQARLLPGDEARMSSLVERTLGRLDETRAGNAPRAKRRLLVSGLRYFAASLACGTVLSVALAKGWEYANPRTPSAAPPAPSAASSATAAPRVARSFEEARERTPEAVAERAPIPSAAPRRHAEPGPHAAAEAVEAALTASELFARASQARREGDIERAIILYERLCSQHPDSVEALDARVLLGNLRLGQRAPRAALQEFEGYDGSGALSLEALWGRAQALRKLGSPEERAVLERLIVEHPKSPYAAAAQKRLQQLSH